MKKDSINKLLFLLLLFFIIGCETTKYVDQTPSPSNIRDGFDGKLSSDLSFSGISAITDFDDTTATLTWSAVNGAVEYHIFDIAGGSPLLIERVLSTETSIRLLNLKSGTDYEFLVRVKDEDGLLDNNTRSIAITTSSTPSEVALIQYYNPQTGDFLSSIFEAADNTPSFFIVGVNVGDTVSLYSDACVTKVAEALNTSSNFIVMTSSELTPASYTFHVKRTNINGVSSACSTFSARSYKVNECPDGYEVIEPNIYLNTPRFCVMKYEAKAWRDFDNDGVVESFDYFDSDGCNELSCTTKNWGTSTYTPVSVADHKPWRNVDINTAQDLCQSVGEGYDLISNKEWMAVATEIESIEANWTGGIVGVGCLTTGNTGLSDTCGYNFGDIDKGTARDSKAEHTLLSGNTIFDISGNVTEWVNWEEYKDITFGPTTCIDSWGEITEDFCLGNLNKYYYMPFNPAGIASSLYNSNYGLGLIEGGTGGIASRGGDYQYAESAGIFTLSLVSSPTTANPSTGFRCVYRP